MKAVVITGAHGYIGSALAKRLADAGWPLRLVSRVSDAPVAPAEILPNMEFVRADLRDERAWADVMAGAEVIIHLSSRTDLRAAEADPAGDERINIEPVRSLIRAAERSGTRPNVVFASTVTIVGIEHANPVDETTPDRPCSVYDRNKLTCETLLREATANAILRACSLRLSNVYGYGRVSVNANRGILNSMMKRAASGEPLTVYGDGSYVRDFTHLDDVVEAFCAAAACDAVRDGSRYVIATGKGHTLAEAFDLVAQEALVRNGRRIEIRHVPEPVDLQPIERRHFFGNPGLFQKLTGWLPQIDLPTGIRDYFDRAASLRPLPSGKDHITI